MHAALTTGCWTSRRSINLEDVTRRRRRFIEVSSNSSAKRTLRKYYAVGTQVVEGLLREGMLGGGTGAEQRRLEPLQLASNPCIVIELGSNSSSSSSSSSSSASS